MRRFLAAAVGCLLVGAGCMKVDQTLSIHKDGSAELQVSYGMSEQTVEQMKAMQAMGEKDKGEKPEANPFDFDEAKIREQMKPMEKEGVKLLEVKTEKKDGWQFMHLKLAIDSLPNLMKTEFFKDDALTLTRNADGNYVFEQKSGGEGNDEQMNEEMMKQMLPMFAGFRAAMTIKTPSDIIETNATEKGDKSASWIYDVDKDPSALMKAQKANMRLVFSGKGLNLPEIKAKAAAPAPKTPAAPAE